MVMEGNIQAASNGHHKSIFSRFDSSGTCVQASAAKKNLRKRNHSPGAVESNARPEHVCVHRAIESRLKSDEVVRSHIDDAGEMVVMGVCKRRPAAIQVKILSGVSGPGADERIIS